jgi:hypothetical protein
MFFANRRLRRDGQQATATVLSCEYRSKWTSNVDALNAQTKARREDVRALRQRLQP